MSGTRTSTARFLNIPTQEEVEEKAKAKDEATASTAVLARQMADHRPQATPTALPHLPSHADCPVCLRLGALGKSAKTAKESRAPLGSAANPIGSRNGRGQVTLPGRAAAAAPASAPVCSTVDAVEQVCAADTGVCTFAPRRVAVCYSGDGAPAMPVILPK